MERTNSLLVYNWDNFDNEEVVKYFKESLSIKDFFLKSIEIQQNSFPNDRKFDKIYLKDSEGENILFYSLLNNEVLVFNQSLKSFKNLRSIVKFTPIDQEIILFKYIIDCNYPLRINFNELSHEIRTGSLLICNHLARYEMDIPKNTELEILTLVVSKEFLKKYLDFDLLDDNLLNRFISGKPDNDLLIFNNLSYKTQIEIEKLYDSLKNGEGLAFRKLTLLNLITHFLLLFFKDYLNLDNNMFKKNIALKVARHLEDSLEMPFPGIKYLAKEVFVSTSTLLRSFKDEYNTTPLQYFSQIKITKAIDYLENSSLTISEIAYKLGFLNPSDFARSFKKLNKLTPSEVREKRKIENKFRRVNSD